MNTTRKVRWGILGAARMSKVMLPAIVAAGNTELVAVASRRPGAAAQLLAECGQENVTAYDDPQALLDDPKVEAVYLPLANEEHGEWAPKVLEHGKHVLVEKPMALQLEDIDRIEAAARERNLKVMEGFMYRFHPQHRRVWNIIEAGHLGTIRSVRATFSFPMTPARLYRISRPLEQGGGALWDIGCYAVHCCRFFYDHEPEAAVAMAKFNEHGADTSVAGALDFGDGRFATFDFGFERARRAEYEIIGTEGGLKCHNVWAKPGDIPLLSWWTGDGRLHEEWLPTADHFRLEIEHFSHCILTDAPPALSLDDARGNCRALNAIVAAIRTGQRTPV
ncbi:D-xylose 1-dehydrogenase (NADP+) [Methylomarinovum caldicuralii]|uniref:D-xylose 1-dehydrogenase (NADP+) n=1 Tax=Methylomarinovum caldicuralii TaxID=438856 RepID=A0AAU9CIL4_9GAMM|nr:Gfo/Idh/MocA family oxidoreductase [Methylomarinovum caldicuralii]BCX81451.1 D-xylose 1-dehydrogenase (NADP+) [Methylomarinovum caldicuralii]